MILRFLAVIFGICFIFAGVGGFFSVFLPNGLLLGLFAVNMLQNVLHIVSGVIAIMAATSYKYSRLYFQIFGILYGLLTITGFVMSGDVYFLMMHFNFADNILHLVITIAALYLGFSTKKRA